MISVPSLRCLFLYPLLLLSTSWLLGQSPPDSSLLVYDLAGLTVAASATQLPIAAPVARLDARAIARYDNTSLLASFNSLAGVRLEERSPGSYRVSIRGSSLRAPFGVRNVKIYWNGLPLTEAGGDTYLNFLDPSNVQDALVFKGPAGSLYGSGTGGAILLNSRSQEDSTAQDALSLQGASFGGLRANWQHSRSQSPTNSHQIRFAHQRSDGYRDHSSFQRSVGELSIYRQGAQGGSSFHILATDLHYDIPGGLNPEQFAENPQQARPGSEAAQAAINYQNLLVGSRFFGQLAAGKIRHQTSLFAAAYVFDHPFNNDHKRERKLGVGLRSTLHYDQAISQIGQLSLTAGIEAQLDNKAARNYAPNAGQPGELNFIDDIVSYQSLVFTQGVLDFNQGWQLTAGLSAQQLQYRVDRSFNRVGNTGQQNSHFEWVWAPRLSLAKTWTATETAKQQYSAFLSYALAYSPPTLSEFRTNEGSINTRLAPEQGHSLEAGLRRNSPLGFDVELNVYYQWLAQSIATYQDDSGVQLFRNSGGSQQVGVEIAVERELLGPKAANNFINSLLARLAYTYTQGQYSGYQVNEQDFSGQALPGLTPSTLDLQLSIRSTSHFYANLGLYSAAKTPLNDANEVFSNAFTLVRARIGKNFQFQKIPMEIYIGGDNLLNENYSLGYDLNPQFGRRFFQPAPGINFFAGWRGHF